MRAWRRVVLICAGDARRGMGHIMRMRVLADALAAYGDCEVSFLVDEETRAGGGLSGLNHPVECLPRTDYETRRRYLSRLRPHVTGVDILDAGVAEMVAYHGGGGWVVAFENLTAGGLVAEVLVNAIVGGLRNRSYRRGNTDIYVGPRYMILDPEFVVLRQTPRPVGGTLERVVISLGGGDVRNLTLPLARWLGESGLAREVVAVLGPVAADRGEEAGGLPESVRVLHTPSDLPRIFHQCDLMVAGGGITLYEASCLGTPCVVIPQADHQLVTARRFERRGSVRCLAGEISRETVLAAVAALADNAEERRRMSAAGRRIVPGTLDPILDIFHGLVRRGSRDEA